LLSLPIGEVHLGEGGRELNRPGLLAVDIKTDISGSSSEKNLPLLMFSTQHGLICFLQNFSDFHLLFELNFATSYEQKPATIQSQEEPTHFLDCQANLGAML
jgi:hypothetical protein